MEIVKLQMCRICLVENVRMHEVADKILQELYEKLTKIPFVTEDSRPMLTCFFCYTKLKQCCQLQRICLEAEKLYAQMLNEDHEAKPLNQDLFEDFNEYIITPTVHISIVDQSEAKLNSNKEFSSACEAQDLILELKQEQLTDIEPESQHDAYLDIYPEQEDPDYLEPFDIPLHQDESDAEDDVPLITFKTEFEEPEVLENGQRAEKITCAPAVNTPELYVRITKLEDTMTPRQKKVKRPKSKIIRNTQNRTSASVSKGPSSLRGNSIKKEQSKNDVTGKILIDKKLNNTRTICTKEKPYKCDKCQTRVTTKNILGRHMREQHGVVRKRIKRKVIQCDQCPRTFCHIDNLTTHIRVVHKGEKPYICDFCERSFAQKCHLKYHIQTHTGDKPFQCEICGHSFITISALKFHTLRHTGAKPYQCDICKKCYTLKPQLKHHIIIQHTGERTFQCEKCDMKFFTKTSLNRHSRVHTDYKSQKCEICHHTFRLVTSLKRHMRTHTGEKPYKCEICNRCFSQSDKLKNHLRQHSGEKPFKCHLCEESYCVRSSLNRHVRLHAGEKPHKCDVCRRDFTYISDLKRHVFTHSSVKPFKCDKCEKSFTQSSSLNTHVRKTHET